MRVYLRACVHICVCVCSSPDRPLEITSLYPSVYWRMVVASHARAQPKSHERSHQLAHHMPSTQKFQKTVTTNFCWELRDLRSFTLFVYLKIELSSMSYFCVALDNDQQQSGRCWRQVLLFQLVSVMFQYPSFLTLTLLILITTCQRGLKHEHGAWSEAGGGR